jgi:hypothetical protein
MEMAVWSHWNSTFQVRPNGSGPAENLRMLSILLTEPHGSLVKCGNELDRS